LTQSQSESIEHSIGNTLIETVDSADFLFLSIIINLTSYIPSFINICFGSFIFQILLSAKSHKYSNGEIQPFTIHLKSTNKEAFHIIGLASIITLKLFWIPLSPGIFKVT